MEAVTACLSRAAGASGVGRRRRLAWLPPAALLTVVLDGEAHAQLIERYFPANIPAYQDWAAAAAPTQTDSDYGPLGVRVGSLMIHPSITQDIGYDSNPFGSVSGNGTAVIDSGGSISVDSDWSRNEANAAFVVDHTQYLSFPSRSFTDWTASAGGVIAYVDDELRVGYSHVNATLLPSDIGSFGLTQPVVNQVDDLRISDTIGTGRLVLVPALVGQIYQFSQASGNGSILQEGLFNRDAITGSVTASYGFAGGHNLVMIVSDTQVQYSGGSAESRPADYNDMSVLLGIEYRQSALLAYRALAGYEERPATGHGTSDGTISGPAAELDVIWRPTVLTTLTGKVSQSLQDQPTGIAQSLTETNTQLLLDHALRRNIMLHASVQYIRATFPMGGATDSTIAANAEATWSISRNLALSLRYDFTQTNDSGQMATSTTRHQIFLQARFQL